MFTYVQSERSLWTVGHYGPQGGWIPESDHGTAEKAAARCAALNGAGDPRPAAAPGAKAARGIQLPCPRCGEPDANLLLHLADGESFTCQECEEEFTADAVRQVIERWAPVLAWLDKMPTAS